VVAAAGEAKVPLLRNARLAAAVKGRMKDLRTKVVYQWNPSASATNTGTAYTLAVLPNNVTESSAFASIFDEVKVTAITVHWSVGINVSASGGQSASQPRGVLGFDPTVSTALTSTSDGMELDQVDGPVSIAAGGVYSLSATTTLYTGAVSNVPLASTRTGFWTKTFKVPPAVVLNPDISSEIVGGAWVSTQATNAIAGYVKAWIEGTGPNTQSVLDAFIVMHVHYRSRR